MTSVLKPLVTMVQHRNVPPSMVDLRWTTVLRLTMQAALALSCLLGTPALKAQPLTALPPPATTLKPEETALIVVDFQNNFAAEKGEHYPRLAAQYRENHMLERAVETVKKARAAGVQVVHVTEGYTNDYRELDWGTTGSFHRAQILRQAWKAGTWAVDLYEPLKPGPADHDILIPNRIAASGFMSNGLDTILKARGIRNVAVMGFNTEICVYATVLSAHDLGYRTYALRDLMISFRPEFANNMLEAVYPYFSRVIDGENFIGMVARK